MHHNVDVTGIDWSQPLQADRLTFLPGAKRIHHCFGASHTAAACCTDLQTSIIVSQAVKMQSETRAITLWTAAAMRPAGTGRLSACAVPALPASTGCRQAPHAHPAHHTQQLHALTECPMRDLQFTAGTMGTNAAAYRKSVAVLDSDWPCAVCTFINKAWLAVPMRR